MIFDYSSPTGIIKRSFKFKLFDSIGVSVRESRLELPGSNLESENIRTAAMLLPHEGRLWLIQVTLAELPTTAEQITRPISI